MQVVRAVGGKIPVLIDGGVRRGTDIFKALALGAQAVLVNSDSEVLTLLTCQYVLLLFCKVLCFMLHYTVLYLIGTIMAGKKKMIVWKTIVALFICYLGAVSPTWPFPNFVSSLTQIGRPILYGLAAKGEYGVRRVIEMLKAELELTMALSGCPTLKDITRSHVRTEQDRLNCRL